MEYGYEIWQIECTKFVQGSFTSDSIKIIKYKIHVVRVQEVRWDGGGTEPAENTHFSMEREMRIKN
jgi:hypothetical protein